MKKRHISKIWLLTPFLILGIFTVSFNFLPLLQNAAMLGVMLNMPEGSIAMLEERFNSEIFTPQETMDLPSSETLPSSEQTTPYSTTHQTVPPPKIEEPQTSSSAQGTQIIEAPIVPEKYRGKILEENFSVSGKIGYITKGTGSIKNYTKLVNEKVQEIISVDSNIQISSNDLPQVLIFHTHATESYEEFDRSYYDNRSSWRSTDNTKNMVAVGDVLEETLIANGINVIHDRTQHDYPSYNGAYERSAVTVKKYLNEYPSIKVVLDVHRDAIDRGGVIVKPTVEIGGKKAAQLMIISGCDDGTMNIPKWRENLRFAADLQNVMESQFPSLTRPIFFCYRKYNMDLSTGSLLLEFGSHANTLSEAKYTAQMVGESLSFMLTDLV